MTPPEDLHLPLPRWDVSYSDCDFTKDADGSWVHDADVARLEAAYRALWAELVEARQAVAKLEDQIDRLDAQIDALHEEGLRLQAAVTIDNREHGFSDELEVAFFACPACKFPRVPFGSLWWNAERYPEHDAKFCPGCGARITWTHPHGETR